MISKLCSILRVHHKTLSMKYLAGVLASGYRNLYLHEFLEEYGLTVNHNTLRSWNRLINNIQQYLPEAIDVCESEAYLTFNDKIFCLIDMLDGSPCRYELTERQLFNKKHIITSMQSLFNINEMQAGMLYSNFYRSTDLPESVIDKINNRFAKSTAESKLTKNFMDNLKYYYSY